MLTSAKVFSCHMCAAQPINQKLQGCFEPAIRPHVILNDFVFQRCPLTYQTDGGYRVIRTHQDGLLQASYETKISTPAKMLSAVHYVEYLRKLREANDY